MRICTSFLVYQRALLLQYNHQVWSKRLNTVSILSERPWIFCRYCKETWENLGIKSIFLLKIIQVCRRMANGWARLSQNVLMNLMPMFYFYTRWKHQTTRDFWTFSGVKKLNNDIKWFNKNCVKTLKPTFLVALMDKPILAQCPISITHENVWKP